MEPSVIDDHVIQLVADTVVRVPRFGLRLARVESFPDAIYLAPDPAERFFELTERLAEAFPKFPPFGGRFDTIVPHLTVAWESQGAVRERIAEDLAPRLPVEAVAADIAVLIEEDDGWVRGPRLSLGD